MAEQTGAEKIHSGPHLLQLFLRHVGLRLDLLSQRPHLRLKGHHVHLLLLRGCTAGHGRHSMGVGVSSRRRLQQLAVLLECTQSPCPPCLALPRVAAMHGGRLRHNHKKLHQAKRTSCHAMDLFRRDAADGV